MIQHGFSIPSFVLWLDRQAQRVDQALARITEQLPQAESKGVAAAMRYSLLGDGKRIRPALCTAAFRAVSPGTADDAVIELACALELIHTYSLVHDDLPCMDNDALRRGRPTTHVEFGTRKAMYAGAALIPLAFRVLLRGCEQLNLTPDGRRLAALELARAAGAAGMVGGQVLDLEAEGRATSLDDLEHLHLAKTGALIAAAARLGARAGQADDEALIALRQYGRCVGLAFQIADDVLDVTATAGRLGKSTGKDRAVSKATFPAFMGLDGARSRAQHEVDQALDALDSVRLRTPELEGLARFAAEREH
jgi:geranylgeranyl pyrophosphate synthase